MKDRSVSLAVRVTAKSEASAVFDQTGAAAKRMGADIDAGTSTAERSASRIDTVADASDNMASRSSQAAGGLGDLGAALAGLPGPLGAAGRGMEAAAAPVMGLVGASDLLNLATTSNIVKTTKARIVTVAHTAATKTMTIAQKALNLAMRANPIGLVITAALVLVGLFVLLYKKSDTFRGIVQAVGRAGEKALGWIIEKAKSLWEKFQALREIAGVVKTWIGDKLSAGFEKLKDIATAALDLIMAPINAIIDGIEWILDKLPSINGSDANGNITDLGPLAPAPRPPTPSSSGSLGRVGTPGDTFNISVSGVLTETEAGATLTRIIDRHQRRNGRNVVFG